MNELLITKIVVCDKLRISSQDIKPESTIEELSDGNSAVANEIMGLLIQELKLSEEVASTYAKKAFGDMSTDPLSPSGKFVMKKLKKTEQSYSNVDFSMSASEKEALLAHLSLEDIDNSQEAVTEYAIQQGIIKASTTGAESNDGGGGGGSVDNKKFNMFVDQQRKIFSALQEDKVDSPLTVNDVKSTDDTGTDMQDELGSEFLSGIQGVFSLDKIRSYGSSWNWIRQRKYLQEKQEQSGQNKDVPIKASIDEAGHVSFVPRNISYSDFYKLLQIKCYEVNGIEKDVSLSETETYNQKLDEPMDLTGKKVVLTGAGADSIGESMCCLALEAGAHVFVTTSRASGYDRWQRLYQEHCIEASTLTVIPCNFASVIDIEKLATYIVSDGVPIDFCAPFAALKQFGTVEDIRAKQELAYRLMATNVQRLIGGITSNYRKRGMLHVPKCTLVLPFSPNVGILGGDGCYGESKLAMLSILNKSAVEPWGHNFTVIAAEIGWTRTSLMSGLQHATHEFERQGGISLSQREMATLMLNCHALRHCHKKKILLDATAGFKQVRDMASVLGQRPTPVAKDKPVIERSAEFESLLPIVPLPEQVAYCETHFKNLERVPVIVGFGEVGAFGTANARWKKEKCAQLDLETCIELAWWTGRIYYQDKSWYDSVTKEPVVEGDILQRYEEDICRHTGIREIDPELMADKADPHRLERLVEYELPDDLGPIPMLDENDLPDFCRLDSNRVIQKDNQLWLQKGTKIKVKKAIDFQNFVAAQVPKGWNPTRYGISEGTVRQVDPVVLYTLVAIGECLLHAGLLDCDELVSAVNHDEVAMAIGTGLGGGLSLKKELVDYREEQNVQSDILQETLCNVIGAWVNMLLVDACGPIVCPVQACATAAVSLNLGEEMIRTGKAKVAFVGATDDYMELGLVHFNRMGATCTATDELAKGRPVHEFSRPTTSTRSGFVEAQGAAIQIVTSAQVALDAGLPIYGIVGATTSACDGFSKSVPAPGKGIKRAFSAQAVCPDPEERYKQVVASMTQYEAALKDLPDCDKTVSMIYEQQMKKHFPNLVQRTLYDWNLDANQVDAISFHGTSTKGNDRNESEICNYILSELGRSTDPCPVICQKYLTGHGKGSAFGFMLNGVLQMMRDSYIPGNRNADDIDEEFKQFDQLLYPNKGKSAPVRSSILHSFGFGQANCQAIIIHPSQLFTCFTEEQYAQYVEKLKARTWRAYRLRQDVLYGKRPLLSFSDDNSKSLSCIPMKPVALQQEVNTKDDLTLIVKEVDHAVGNDAQLIGELPLHDPVFIERNFTVAERTYCEKNSDMRKQRFAGRWSAKEAVLKAIGAFFDDGKKILHAGDSLIDIEVLPSESGQPVCVLTGKVLDLATKANIDNVQVTISHSGEYSFAVATVHKCLS